MTSPVCSGCSHPSSSNPDQILAFALHSDVRSPLATPKRGTKLCRRRERLRNPLCDSFTRASDHRLISWMTFRLSGITTAITSLATRK